MDSTIYTKLITTTAITDLVGEHIFPVIATPDYSIQTAPAILYSRQATQDVVAMSGPVGLKKYTYQIDTWAINEDDCRSVADAVYGTFSTWKDNDVQGCFLTNSQELQEQVGYHTQQTFDVWG
jgi:hypothetical protein